MMDFLLKESGGAIDRLDLEQIAEMGLLPDELSISDISRLCCADKNKRLSYVVALVDLCKSEKIKYYGDIRGFQYGGNEFNFVKNPYPKIKGSMVDMGDSMRTFLSNRWKAAPADCLIHKDDFKQYLINTEHWPVTDGLIKHWFGCKRRKYIPAARPGASESLSLIDEIIRDRKIKYFDELDGSQVWGLLVSGEVHNERIKSLPTSDKGKLRMTDGEAIDRSDFIKKYSNRFEKG